MVSQLPRMNCSNEVQEVIDFDLNQGGLDYKLGSPTTPGFIVVKRKKSKFSVHRITKRNEKTTVEEEKRPAKQIRVELGDWSLYNQGFSIKLSNEKYQQKRLGHRLNLHQKHIRFLNCLAQSDKNRCQAW